MPRARVDGFLSGKAQAVWPSAVVTDEEGEFVLRRHGHEDLSLGYTFKDARGALYALLKAARAVTVRKPS